MADGDAWHGGLILPGTEGGLNFGETTRQTEVRAGESMTDCMGVLRRSKLTCPSVLEHCLVFQDFSSSYLQNQVV